MLALALSTRPLLPIPPLPPYPHPLRTTGGDFAAAVALRCEVCPEDGVVHVTAAVELDRLLECDLRGDVVCLERLVELLLSLVEVGDVRLVVLLVVQLHDLAAHNGLKFAIAVREVGQRVQAPAAQPGDGERATDGEHDRRSEEDRRKSTAGGDHNRRNHREITAKSWRNPAESITRAIWKGNRGNRRCCAGAAGAGRRRSTLPATCVSCPAASMSSRGNIGVAIC